MSGSCLQEAQVREIFYKASVEQMPHDKIAAEYDIDPRTVWNILNGRTWNRTQKEPQAMKTLWRMLRNFGLVLGLMILLVLWVVSCQFLRDDDDEEDYA